MLVLVTLMIASVGSLIGSGTVSTVTFRLPCHVTARMNSSSVGSMSSCPLRRRRNLRSRQDSRSVAPRCGGPRASLAIDDHVDPLIEEADQIAHLLGVVQWVGVGPRDVAGRARRRQVRGPSLVRAIADRVARN